VEQANIPTPTEEARRTYACNVDQESSQPPLGLDHQTLVTCAGSGHIRQHLGQSLRLPAFSALRGNILSSKARNLNWFVWPAVRGSMRLEKAPMQARIYVFRALLALSLHYLALHLEIHAQSVGQARSLHPPALPVPLPVRGVGPASFHPLQEHPRMRPARIVGQASTP